MYEKRNPRLNISIESRLIGHSAALDTDLLKLVDKWTLPQSPVRTPRSSTAACTELSLEVTADKSGDKMISTSKIQKPKLPTNYKVIVVDLGSFKVGWCGIKLRMHNRGQSFL